MATRFCFSRLTKCFYFLLFILLIWSCGTSNSNPSSTSSPLKVIAYYAGGADRIDDFNLEGVDQLIYSFLHLKGNRLALDNAADSLTLLKLTGLKANYPQLKVLVSLGGWGGCKTCSDVFNTPEGREEFAQSTAEILAHYKAFTEKGLYMLATILKSKQATQATLQIVETFAKVREFSKTAKALALETDTAKQQGLLQKSGALIGDILNKELAKDTSSETTIELNLAMLKIKHTIKKEPKK